MEIEQLEALRARLLAQSEKAQKLLAILYDEADWVDRHTLSRRLKRDRLNPHDMQMLDRLAAEGLVDLAKRPFHGKHGFEYIYRLKGDIHRGLNALKVYRRPKV